MKSWKYIILIIGLFSLVACTDENPIQMSVGENPEQVTVQASWIANGQFSFVCSAIVEGFYEDVGLEVELKAGGPAISFARSSTLLAQNEDIHISIESVLTEYVEGRAYEDESDQLRVKAIGAFWQNNPLGFLVREDGPKDLKDLFTGTKPDGSPWVIGASPDAILIESLADYFDVRYENLNIITTSFDATPFLLGEVDALWSFWTTQAYEAYVAEVPYRFLSLSEVPGLRQPSNIILTREEILRDNPDMLERWFEASLKGAEFTINNPEEATRNVLDERCGGPDFDYEQEFWLIENSLPLFEYKDQPECVGYLDANIVSSWAENYLNITGNPNVPSKDILMDFSILDKVYGRENLVSCQKNTEG